MPLDTTNFHPQGPVKSVDLMQFYNLFTGLMTDQPIAFSNSMTIGGNQGVATVPVRVYGAVGQNTDLIDLYADKNQAQPGFGFSATGRLGWGPGGAGSQDSFLSRTGTQIDATNRAGLYVTPDLHIAGPLQQVTIATPANPPTGAVKIYPKANLHVYSLDSTGVETDLSGAGGVVVTQEFMPANGATTITLAQVPSSIIYASRNGVVQSQADGHYTAAGAVLTFSVAFDGNDRVEVSYPTAAVMGTALDGSITNVKLAGYPWGNADLKADTARRNLLTNGGFEIWQRGNGPFTAATGPDRWSISPVGTDTLSVSRDSTNIDTGSTYAAACTFTFGTGAGASNLWMQLNLLGDGPNLRGQTISLSVRVRTATANAVRIGINNYYASTAHYTYSAFHTGGGTWQTLTVTATMDATATYCQPMILFAASCTAYIDNAMLVVGSVAADYAPLHPADDLARCLRYYEIIGETQNEIVFNGYNAAGQTSTLYIPYKARKAVTPTFTKNGTWNVTNCSQPGTLGTGIGGFGMYATVTALNPFTLNNNAGGANFTLEGNP